jgi:hypothetical protein
MKSPIDKSKNIIRRSKVPSRTKKTLLETNTTEESLKQLFDRLLKPIDPDNFNVSIKYDQRFLSLLNKVTFKTFDLSIENVKPMPNKSKALEKERNIKFLELKREYPNVNISTVYTREHLIYLKRFYLINRALKDNKHLSEKEKINIVKTLVKNNPSIFNNE